MNRYIAYIDSLFDHNDIYYYFKDSTVINPAYNIDSLIRVSNLVLDSTAQVPVYRDTVISYPQTNYPKSILEQDAAMRAGKMAQVIKNNGKFEFSLVKFLKKLTGHCYLPLPIHSLRINNCASLRHPE